MATSIEHDLVSAVEHEISCPICFEDFEEPKCLPNCAHNVCQQCLQGMEKKRNNVIECPVCRAESVIPKGGVAAFPKNHLLVRLIEQSPGRKEKRDLKQAAKSWNNKLEEAEAALKEMRKRYEATKLQHNDSQQRIENLAENIVRAVRDQEQKMLNKIKLRQDQNEESYEMLQSSIVELKREASSCVKLGQKIMEQNPPGKFKELNKYKNSTVNTTKLLNEFCKELEERMLKVKSEFTKTFDISLTKTDLAEKFIKDEYSLGELNINTDVASIQLDTPTALGTSVWKYQALKLEDYSSCGSFIQDIDKSSCGTATFDAFSVAASRHSGNIVVLDEKARFVYIFNEEGEKLREFRIKQGDLFDVVVSNNEEIVVLNRERNRLLHYDMDGHFQKKIVSAPKDNVKFTSCTVDIHGCFIIASQPRYEETTDDTLPCILVYTPSGNNILSFGKEHLCAPAKAVFLNGKFYVTDLDSVKVFDKFGSFLNSFEDHHLICPSGIAADYISGNIVIGDKENLSVHIYNQAQQCLHCFETENEPQEIAFTKNYKNLLICFYDCDFSGYVQMLTYC